MATWRNTLNAVQGAINTALSGQSPACTVFLDLPPPSALASLARGTNSLVSIFDLHMARNTTRWRVFGGAYQTYPTGIVSVVSNSQLLPSLTQTITISGTMNAGDAVSCVIQSGIINGAAVYTTNTGDTDTLIATGLTALINSSTATNPYISATSTGPVVTITNNTHVAFNLLSLTGNTGVNIQEVARSLRVIQVSAFTQTEVNRENVGNAILGWVGTTQANFGLPVAESVGSFSGNSWARVMYAGDEPQDNTHMPDIYRWNILLEVEFGITTNNLLWSVLAPYTDFQITD